MNHAAIAHSDVSTSRVARKVLHYKPGLFVWITEGWIVRSVESHRRWKPIVCTGSRSNDGLRTEAPVMELDRLLLADHLNALVYRLTGFDLHVYLSARRYHCNLIHAHYGPNGARAARTAAALGVPLITTYYGYDLDHLHRCWPAERKGQLSLFRIGTLFTVQGPHMAGTLARLGCPPEKIRVVPLGVPIEQYRFMRRDRVPDEPLRLLLVGSYREKKGIPLALEAMAEVRRRGLHVELTVVGDIPPDDRGRREAERIQRIFDAHALADCVRLTGYLPPPELREVMYRHHVALVPSLRASDGDCEGGLPVAAIEMAATGLPLIASDHCDLPQLVQPGGAGWVFREGDCRSLVDAIDLMFADAAGLAERSVEARRVVERKFNLARTGELLEQMYDEALDLGPVRWSPR